MGKGRVAGPSGGHGRGANGHRRRPRCSLRKRRRRKLALVETVAGIAGHLFPERAGGVGKYMKSKPVLNRR